MKTNIWTIHNALDILLVVHGEAFTYLNELTTHYGSIAQGLKEVLPEAVIEDLKQTRPISTLPETCAD